MKKAFGRRVLVALAVLAMATGTAALATGIAQSRAGGYVTTETGSFHTATPVLLTDEIDVGTGLPADPEPDLGELARLRIQVVSTDPDAVLFVGIAPREVVDDYLAGTAHDEFVGATSDPFLASFERVAGAHAAPLPATHARWTAQSTGRGGATLEWDKAAGPWSLVVANADGSPGLDVRADLGFRFGFLAPLGGALLVAGGLLVATLAHPSHRRRRGPFPTAHWSTV